MSLESVEKVLFGNGRAGLVEQFTILKTEHEEMKDDLKSLATSFSALAKLDSNREAVRKYRAKALTKASLITGMFGTLITLIIKLLP